MTTPFYVSPEQIMKDKSDYARKMIARGRPVLVMAYRDGILFVGENPSNALHKISEIYDRIAFAAVGKYNEFENLRLAGIRYADLTGYQFDRRDVTARGLANAYAQSLGSIFTESGKPYEVELVVAEVGVTQDLDVMYRITYDGSVADETQFVTLGNAGDAVTAHLKEHHTAELDLQGAVRLGLAALATGGTDGPREIPAGDLEVAVLDRTRPRRAFKRIPERQLTSLLGEEAPADGDGA